MNDQALVLRGHVVNEADESRYEELRAENRQLRRQLAEAQANAATARRDVERAVKQLRQQLTPLYRGLQAVFGEMDAFGEASSDHGATETSPRIKAVWDAWKAKIGGQPALLIDAMLLHGEMTSSQIAIAIGINPKNVAQVVHKLNKAGLIQKNGNKFSLKTL